jgi:pimeloyl-ACP methyl ester carboxylesterase
VQADNRIRVGGPLLEDKAPHPAHTELPPSATVNGQHLVNRHEDKLKDMFVRNASTFLDELQDPNRATIDTDALAGLEIPVRLTQGSESPQVFPRVLDRLESVIPHVTRETIKGAAHLPHLTTPGPYIEATKRAVQSAGGHYPTVA